MARRIPTRKDDETLLDWLRLRSDGMGSTSIAGLYGVSNPRIRVATNRVVKDDVAHEGEQVLCHYWPDAQP